MMKWISVLLMPICIFGAINPNLVLKEYYQNYSSDVKPKRNLSEPVEVSIKLHIDALREINERFQTMTFFAWFELNWTDEFLILKDGINAVTLPLKEVWTPDVSLFNSVEDPQYISDGKHLVLLREGRMVWYPARQYTVRCSIDIRMYPFDKQRCEIKVGAWQAPVWTQVFVTDSDSLMLGSITENGEWILSKTSVESNFSSQFSISWIRYVLHFQRRFTYNIVNTVLPIVLLSFLNTLVFRLPANSGEKITLCISILLSFTVFLTIFNENMPRMSTNISYLSIYLCVQLSMSVLGIVASVELCRLKMYRESKDKKYRLQRKPRKSVRKYCVADKGKCHLESPFVVGLTKMDQDEFKQTTGDIARTESPDLNGNRINSSSGEMDLETCDTEPIIQTNDEKIDKYLFYTSLTVTVVTTIILFVMLLKDQ